MMANKGWVNLKCEYKTNPRYKAQLYTTIGYTPKHNSSSDYSSVQQSVLQIGQNMYKSFEKVVTIKDNFTSNSPPHPRG